MSKTIRRKNAYNLKHWTSSWEKRISKYGGTYWCQVKLQGEELAKAMAKFHCCKHGYWSFPNKYSRHRNEDRHRTDCKKELIKFKKNPDYPVQIHRTRKLPWD